MDTQNTQPQQQVNYSHVKFADAPARTDDESKLAFTKTFHIEYTDPDTQQLHTGSLSVRRLSIAAYAETGVLRARLDGGLQVAPMIGFVNEMRAYLQVAITSAPEWWDLDNSYDLALLRATYDYVTAWEGSFRRRALAQRRE